MYVPPPIRYPGPQLDIPLSGRLLYSTSWNVVYVKSVFPLIARFPCLFLR